MFNLSRFEQMLAAVGAKTTDPMAFQELARLHSQADRFYHNREHVADCLMQFDRHCGLARQPACLEAAIWFHDAIYESRRRDNELRSADLAAEVLGRLEVSEDSIDVVVQLILATKHDKTPTQNDAQLMVDIDLSILGRDEARFTAYDDAIAQEYAWAAEADYRVGRAAVLRSLLERPRLFLTPVFRQEFEDQARRNLANALRHLETPH